MIVVNSRFLTQKITGVQRHAIELSLKLKRMIPNIQFIAPKNIIHTDIAASLEAKPVGNKTGHFWEQVDLPRYLKKNYAKKPLLLNLANTAPLFYKNKIVTIHDVSFLRNPIWFSKKFYYFYRFLIPRIAQNSRLVITDSEFSKNEILHFIDIQPEKIKIVHSAVSPKFLNAGKTGENNQYGKYILAVSSQAPGKNFERIVKSFNLLDLSDINLVIVGATHSNFAKNRISKMTENNPRIFLPGYLKDNLLVNLYKNAELFVYPSLYEGFGLPPLEAMACGCPTVVSNAASLPEICGDATIYCNPYEIDDIAEKINAVLSDQQLREKLILKGFEHIKKFNWKQTANALLDNIKEIVGT